MDAQPDLTLKLIEDTLRDHQGVSGPIEKASRLCRHLGVCDEDLSELVEELFAKRGFEIPHGVTILPNSADDISVMDLAAFLDEWSASRLFN